MDLVLGVVSFTGIVLLLVVVILLARSQLVASGNVSITINGDEAVSYTHLTLPTNDQV